MPTGAKESVTDHAPELTSASSAGGKETETETKKEKTPTLKESEKHEQGGVDGVAGGKKQEKEDEEEEEVKVVVVAGHDDSTRDALYGGASAMMNTVNRNFNVFAGIGFVALVGVLFVVRRRRPAAHVDEHHLA